MLTNVMRKSKIYNLRNRKNPLLAKIKNSILRLKSVGDPTNNIY